MRTERHGSLSTEGYTCIVHLEFCNRRIPANGLVMYLRCYTTILLHKQQKYLILPVLPISACVLLCFMLLLRYIKLWIIMRC